ncbi:hypothetical protein [Bacillus sp. AFS040349]|uniref:hypothetical protein n=1 Tax=Bacillus sp. AFS040349 TaxID=2033502 RepID=UPI000BFD1096|nr:hypothetical protein [Bacillus sp. AFS040349]PGT88756.1 hypothetical protein COD11_05435 [Bacillus sp. AFS040349]
MKKIQQLKELLALKQELQRDLMQYLEEEFSGLYEYLNNGEKLEDFILPDYQNMVILEEDEEINKILSRTLDVEFVEEVELNSVTVIRIGLNCEEDIQLNYAIKSY